MKLIAFLILFSSTIIFPQQNNFKSILQLEETVKNSKTIDSNDDNINFNSIDLSRKKSTGLAIVYSLLLPGMGELYADKYSSGKYFTIAEGALWGTYIGMSIYANNQEDNYKTFATVNALVNTEGKDDNYFATISEFEDIESYNDEKALERNFNEMFDLKTSFWKWNSSEERKTYRSMWLSSEQTFNDLRFVVGAMILNRVISAINAARLVSSYNNRVEDELSWNISLGMKSNINLPTSLNLNFQTSF
ncbi:MAG: hypothetical protein IH819_03030 [Bacteroidetes bacterium]|nr:hypothetical protein [Bacteroidota bacterium]